GANARQLLRDRHVEKTVGLGVKPQQGFHAPPQRGVAGAGLVQEGGALLRVFVEPRQKDRLFTHRFLCLPHSGGASSPLSNPPFPAEWRHEFRFQESWWFGPSPPISRRSQARAKAQSRSAVRGETPRALAASGIDSPAK